MGIENREEAAKCLRIARSALELGDLAKAQRFAEKAEGMYETQEAKDILQAIAKKSSANGAAEGEPRRRGHPSKEQAGPSTSQGQKRGAGAARDPDAGTPEQKALVRRILSTKDYYEILGVNKDVTEDGIKKAYRKLALKIHPDKCSAAGTEEAFKLVSTAFSVLSDPDKKADYDRWGPNGPPTMAAGPRGHPGGFGVSEDEAERIFRMFFGGGPFGFADEDISQVFIGPGGRVYRRRTAGNAGGARQEQRPPNPQDAMVEMMVRLLFLLPLLWLVGGWFMSGSAPAYRFEPVPGYKHPLQTPLGVRYFVESPEHFHATYPVASRKLQQLEESINLQWCAEMEERCSHEKHQASVWHSRGYSMEYIKSRPMPGCQELLDKFGILAVKWLVKTPPITPVNIKPASAAKGAA